MLFLLLAALQAPTPIIFHVAQNETVETARDAVRELKRKQGGRLKQPVTIFVHGGTHTLSQPLRFTAEDSGTADCPVTYAAWQNDRPVLSGGRSIAGWKEATVDGKRLWAAEIPAVRDGKWYFRELWVNGQRRPRARQPNDGFFRVAAVPGLDVTKPYHQGQERFQFAPGDIQRWKNPEDVDLVFLTFWISYRRNIAELDEARHMVTLNRPSTMRLTDGFGSTPKLARYYVENAFELLDAPGEWYLNRKTGVLYYMPAPGDEIGKMEAIAPVIEQLMLVDGAEYVTFRGLTFSHAEWWPRTDGRPYQYEAQAASGVPGAVQLSHARHCSFEKCTISHVGSNAIHFSRGCERDRLVRSDLFDLGTGGVKVGEPDRIGNLPPGMKSPFPDDPKEETHDIEISDNNIHQGSRLFHQGHGILVGQSYNNLISHNAIHDFYQNGISVGWTWGYGKSLAHDNVVEYNHIYQIGQRWSSDLAGIYTLGMQPGTVLRNNLIHDVKCADYVGRGIYLDEGSEDIVVENNILYDTTTGGFGLNYGRRNTIRNNIFAFGEQSQIEPVGGLAKPEALAGSSYVVERNIFYWKAGHNVLRNPWRPKKTDDLVLRRNLYWQEGGGEAQTGYTLDAASIVADPLFVAPEKGDFRLKPGSPALKIGFQPFDLSTAGPRRDR